jgi:hypothetical protein
LLGLFLTISLNGFAADKGPDIRIIDDKISIQAEAVPIARLLKLLDQATGMTSKVPPELANRTVSVRFSNLNFDDAIHRIFEGQPLDYVLIEGHGVVVTAASQTVPSNESAPVSFTPPPQPENNFPEDMNPNFPPPNQQPVIQTPFGPIQNPRAVQNNGQPVQQGIPGSQPFPSIQQTIPGQQVIPGQQQPGTVTPDNGLFGASNGVFGNSVPAFNPNPVNISPAGQPQPAPNLFPAPTPLQTTPMQQQQQPTRKP